MSRTTCLTVALALLLPGLAQATPDPQKVEKAYGKGYTTARFEAADTNKDGLVTRDEAAAAAIPTEKKALGSAARALAGL